MRHELKAPLLYSFIFAVSFLTALIPNGIGRVGELLLLICTLPWSIVSQFLVLFFIHEGVGFEAQFILSVLAGLVNTIILFLLAKRKGGVE